MHLAASSGSASGWLGDQVASGLEHLLSVEHFPVGGGGSGDFGFVTASA